MITLDAEWLRLLTGFGITSAVALMGMTVRELRSLNSKISDLMVRETIRDMDLITLKSTISKLPCVNLGFHCPSKE